MVIARAAATLIALALTLGPARGAAQNSPEELRLSGNWQGSVTLGATTIRVGLVVSPAPGGSVHATLIAIDQDGAVLPVASVSLRGDLLHLDLSAIRGVYDGTVAADGQSITGTLTQGMPVPLTFRRVLALDPVPTFGASEAADVRTAIDRYFATFTANDFQTFRELVDVPWALWPIGAPPVVLTNPDDVVARSRSTREGLQSTDYAVSRAVRMSITPLSATGALVDIHWRRDKQDGSLFGEGAEILVVTKTGTGWRVVGNIPRALSHYGKAF